jgi:hypothetical protein
MRADEFIVEHKKGVRAKKYNKKPKKFIEPIKPKGPEAHKVKENFADGKHPEDKGDSARYGIPKHASISTLRKIAKQGGRKGQLAHWQANTRSGRNK